MNTLSRTWGVWVVRGIASILFGALTLMRPGSSVAALVIVYGAYALADGALLLGYAFRTDGPKAPYAWRGLVSVAAGALAFVYPGLTAVSLYILIGAWALASGATEIGLAIAIGKEGVPVGPLVGAGVLSIVCGVALLALPMAGVVALLGLIAGFAIVHGIALITAGIRLHHVTQSLAAG
jgi:uncharacterized membrane protein HdeD (DUF308 family)